MTTAETPQPEPVGTPSIPAYPTLPDTPKSLTWPDWHGVVDLGAAVLLVITAFLVGSFTATNSDLWPHLAIGRMISEGKSSFGVDPFSYATAGRYWVNHAWLWDVAAYVVYSKDTTGSWLVTLKACAFAGAVVVLLLIRRKGDSLWPWVIGGILAMLAGATFAQVRPFIVNPLMLMLTLFVLYRVEWKAGSFRNALILAGLFAIWGNLDNGFIFGPIVVGISLLGELIQSVLLKGRDSTSGAFGPPPSIRDLAIAFGISTVACMANPHHVHVWTWPTEFVVGLPVDDMLDDPETINAVLSPLSEKFYNVPWRGYNANGLAALLLYIGTFLSFALSFRYVRVAHLLLALVFGYLGLRQIQLLLPATFVLAALMAGYLNVLAGGIVLRSWGHPPSRLIFLGSGIGRLLTVLLAVMLVPFAWPGWLHPANSNRRVSWAVEPDEGLVSVATSVKEWRSSGALPAEANGFYASVEFANYLTWFAPGERVYMTGRYGYHIPELPAFLELRRTLLRYDTRQPINADAVTTQLRAIAAEYFGLIGRARIDAIRLNDIANVPTWSIWSFSGRGVIVGTAGRAGLSYDPARELFGAGVQPLPAIVTVPPAPPRESWADDFLRAPKTLPSTVNDSQAYMEYSQILGGRYSQLMVAPLGGLGAIVARPIFDDEIGLPILAIRAGRRAIEENPDDYRSFMALLQPYASRQLPELFTDELNNGQLGERKLQTMTLGRRILNRIPPPERCNIDQANLGFAICQQMVEIAGQTNQKDVAYELFGKMKGFYKRGPGLMNVANRMAEATTDEQRKQIDDQYKKVLEQLDSQENQIEKPVLDAKGQLRRANVTGPQKFMGLLQLGLPKEAITEFEQAKEGEVSLAQALQTANLMINTGDLEKAVPLLGQIRKTLEDGDKIKTANPQEIQFVQGQLPDLEFRVKVLEGNYRQAADILERYYSKLFPTLPEQFKEMQKQATSQSIVAAQALGSFAMMNQGAYVETVNRQYEQQLGGESRFAFQAALLAIYDGRSAEALSRLNQSLSPQGDSQLVFPWTSFAKRYRTLIGRYQK